LSKRPAPSSLVTCCCGCGTKLDVCDALGINGKWARVEHTSAALKALKVLSFRDLQQVIVAGLSAERAWAAGVATREALHKRRRRTGGK